MDDLDYDDIFPSGQMKFSMRDRAGGGEEMVVCSDGREPDISGAGEKVVFQSMGP